MHEAAIVADVHQLWAQHSPHSSREAHRHKALIEALSPAQVREQPQTQLHPPPPYHGSSVRSCTHSSQVSKPTPVRHLPMGTPGQTASSPQKPGTSITWPSDVSHIYCGMVLRSPFASFFFLRRRRRRAVTAALAARLWSGSDSGLMMMMKIKKKSYLFGQVAMPLQPRCCSSACPLTKERICDSWNTPMHPQILSWGQPD